MDDKATAPLQADKARPKFRLPDSVKLGFLFFGIAASYVLYAVPHLASTDYRIAGSVPPFSVFLVTGLVLIALSAGLFALIQKSGLGLRRSTLVLSFGFSCVLIAIKFCLAPIAMYRISATTGFEVTSADPNLTGYYITTGIVILVLYALTFRAMYRHYLRRYYQKVDPGSAPKRISVGRIIGRVLLGIVTLVALTVASVFMASGIDYIGYVFGGLGLPIFVAIGLAFWLATRGYREATEQAIALKSPTAIAAFFWVGLSLILLYHVLWVVFMVMLVQLWPFNTYTSK